MGKTKKQISDDEDSMEKVLTYGKNETKNIL